ncbi:hypothetical protein ARTSIC4J27_2083 [Pseudarthrobacter siccitolerans]|uniref:ER-bound oxygenase mpaB/mpaB'/Rubber oxygenase catalytic domain-containing protein n=1 Tax=Pseudarthrobacter siccitolerans TaxID=861266 RepID=A0A024H287_9MICC|nr:hypothetical protein [Pseudarthrobacter siccitolerans]CCQ46123.1 hypothetical protein ARTSIC4J27_2083 [Pseudarthrobacter siccitolerans]
MTKQRGYKWISAEIERLDPNVDYETIWKLSTCYWVNDFMMSFLYTTGFPHFTLPPTGPKSLEATNKIFARTDKREEDTTDHLWTWFERGPSSPEMQKSVDIVNKIHEAIWKKNPGLFSNVDDFIYTICVLGADMHRLRLRVGMPGFTENQRIATHKYWYEVSKMFLSEVGPVSDQFPENFEGMLTYMADFEARDWPQTDVGHKAAMLLIDKFGENWFPKGFHWVGRNLIKSLLDEPSHRVHRIPYTSRFVTKIFELIILAAFFAKEKVLPDPTISTPERHREAAAKLGQLTRTERKFKSAA